MQFNVTMIYPFMPSEYKPIESKLHSYMNIWQLRSMFPPNNQFSTYSKKWKTRFIYDIFIPKCYISIPTFLDCCDHTVGSGSVPRRYFLLLLLLCIVVIKNLSTSLLQQKYKEKLLYRCIPCIYSIMLSFSIYAYQIYMIGSKWCYSLRVYRIE